MTQNTPGSMSRRERQIMEIVYRLGRSTAREVKENLPDDPSYSAVRALLRVLEGKGHLTHEQDGPRYVYLPTIPVEEARQSALRGLLRNFFADSHEQMIAALLDDPDSQLSAEELDRLTRLIAQARKEGR